MPLLLELYDLYSVCLFVLRCLLAMRFIENISQETISMLQRIDKQSKHHRVRQRAHCILLSLQRYFTTELLKIFQVDRITIYHGFDAWNIHVRRDSRSSIAYSEELISATMSATFQSMDRHDEIVGQKCCHFQRDL